LTANSVSKVGIYALVLIGLEGGICWRQETCRRWELRGGDFYLLNALNCADVVNHLCFCDNDSIHVSRYQWNTSMVSHHFEKSSAS